MMTSHKELFTRFKIVHDQYALDPEKWQKEFNEIGEEVSDVIRKYERILCGHTEAGKYGKYSTNLSEKFKDEIRKEFPQIDFIGTIYS